MTAYTFSPEMMKERESQLIQALTDSAGECYDINFTRNMILGNPIQIVDGVPYSMYDQIGLQGNSSFTEFINYWIHKISPEETENYKAFFNIENITKRYEAGERLIEYQYWTKDVCGNSMLAIQKIRLYKDINTGDLLGLTYITDGQEPIAFRKRESQWAQEYEKISSENSLLEKLSANVPGGYHRCDTSTGFKLQFVSQSFLDVVGWTREEIEKELNNEYLQIVVPEDRDFFLAHEPELQKNGRVDLVYRIRRKDGSKRWIQDATICTEQNGKQFYQCTLSDITEYVEKLNAEKERAEASSLAKSTFLFNASHDIRTPMNAILGFARIIEENVNHPEIVQDAVHKIIQSGNTLTTLINDILEVARIERGKDEVECRPLNMQTHINKLYEMFVAEMEQAGLHFYQENDIQHPLVLGDDLKLTRIAMNLLSNAKKFTAPGGTVTFGVRESEYDGKRAAYTLCVRDTGIGMSQEFQNRAFEQFERERTSTESGIVGSGLGLAIIKRLCELMNGEYHINSELGKGTEITIKAFLQLTNEAAVNIDHTVDCTNFSGKRILLVEDNEFNREIARYTLEDANFTVEEAENGFIAVDKILKAPPGYYDLVLMDIQMPVMDGYTATKEIRNIDNQQQAEIPIIAMTANAFSEDKEKCLECGMNGHLSKPLDVNKLMCELSEILSC